MRELSKNDWRVLARLLEMARDEFHEHGSNDLTLEETPENIALVRELLDSQGMNYESVGIDNGKVWTGDDELMGFFANIARENAK